MCKHQYRKYTMHTCTHNTIIKGVQYHHDCECGIGVDHTEEELNALLDSSRSEPRS